MDEHENEIKVLKALSHPARLAILEVLREGEACVCHMEALFEWRQAYISQQLMVLREAGLVTDRRDGWNIFYRVDKPEVYAVIDAVYRLSGRKAPFELPVNAHGNCTCPNCQAKTEQKLQAGSVA
ncbi:MAG: helix-turn-helix transcriptional regulator [Anaerolineales bacterium]|nr:helix-turn-helix transcriptional regulator [Anaerolineales bacterium]